MEGDLHFWQHEDDLRSNSWWETTKQTLSPRIFFRKFQQEGPRGEENFHTMIRAILSRLLELENYNGFILKRTVPELACLLFPGRADKTPSRPLGIFG